MESNIIQDSERTIDEVYDKKTGNYIQSDDFFKQPEDVIMHWRRYLSEAALMNEPRLVCSHCHQMVKLSGRKTERGKVVFFSHLYDSDDCEIKTGGNKTREEILAEKYGRISESERHFRLKNLLADYLSTNKSKESGISNVEVEKRVKSNIPYLSYRRPDVTAVYKRKNLVFELQLSTTFLDVVVDRDIFYRLNNYFIIWVFNFDENQEYVNLRNLMMKDIYYANKRNIFVFDEEAQYLSEENDCLYLHCMWMQEDGTFSEGKFITLDELSFDEETNKPFFLDADEIFYQLYPERKEKIEQLERSRQSILESLMKRMADDQLKEEREKERVLQLENKMKASGKEASLYSSWGEYGFKIDDEIITSAQFDEVKKVDTGDYITQKGEYKGLVNRYGRILVPCQYKEVVPLFNNTTIVLNKNKWVFYEGNQEITNNRKLDKIEIKDINDNVKLFIIHDGRKKAEADQKFLFFKNSCFWEAHEIKCENSVWKFSKPNYRWDFHEITPTGLIVDKRKNNTIIARTPDGKFYGLLDENYKLLTSFSYSSMKYLLGNNLKVFSNNGYGIINYEDDIVFECKYRDIEQLGDRIYKIKTNDKDYWQIIDSEGNVLFENIGNLYNKEILKQAGDYIVFKEYDKCGLLDLNGTIKLEAKYSGIEEWDKVKGIIKVWNHWRDAMLGDRYNYCFLNSNLSKITSKNLTEINVLDNGLIITKDYDHVYIYNSKFELLFKAEGNKIKNYTDNYVIVEIKGHPYSSRYESYLRIYSFEKNPSLISKELFYEISSFEDIYAKVRVFREDGKVMDAIIDKEFKSLLSNEIILSNGFIKATSYGRWGVLDKNKNIIIPFKYTDIREKDGNYIVQRGEARYSGSPNYYESLLNQDGHIIPDTKYPLDNGYYKVGFQGLYGIWGENDEEIIPLQYNRIDWVTGNLYKVRKYSSAKYEIINDKNLSLLKCGYEFISLMENGYVKFSNYNKLPEKTYGFIGGFMSPDGEIIVYGDFEGNSFENHRLLMRREHGESWVTDKGEIETDEEIILDNGLVKFRQFGLYGVKDKEGNFLLPCGYLSILYCSDLDIYISNEESAYTNGKTIFWDKDFKEIKDFQNGEKILSYVGNGLFIIENIQKEQGVINLDWKRIIPCKYNEIRKHGDYFIVSKIEDIGNRWNYKEIKLFGVYTIEGLCVGACNYRKVEAIGNRFWKLWYQDTYKFNTFRGTELRAQKIWRINKEYYKIEWLGKKGVIDSEINTIVPVKYQDVKFENNKFIVLDGIKWIDYETNEIIDEIKTFVVGIQYKGKITNFQKYGFFVKVEGIGSGLVHISEIQSHFRKLKDYKKDQEVRVKVKSFKDGKPNFALC